MILYPNFVSSFDLQWNKACALMQMLPLSTRLKTAGGDRRSGHKVAVSASDLLIRPEVYDTFLRKNVPAPYYCYDLSFSQFAVRICGTINVDSVAELAEFQRVVGAAIKHPLTRASEKAAAIKANYGLQSHNPQFAEMALLAEASELERFASAEYTTAVMDTLLSPGRRHILCVATASFELLVARGETVLKPKLLSFTPH